MSLWLARRQIRQHKLCQHHQCPCGATVDAKRLDGLRGLSRKEAAAGRSARHHSFNDLVWRAISKPTFQQSKIRQVYWEPMVNDQMASHSYHEEMEGVSHGTSQWRIRWQSYLQGTVQQQKRRRTGRHKTDTDIGIFVHGDCSRNHGSRQQRRYCISLRAAKTKWQKARLSFAL